MIKAMYSRLLLFKKRLWLSKLQKRGLKLGESVQIWAGVIFDYQWTHLIEIGDNTVISSYVQFLAHDESMLPFVKKVKASGIKVEENCFIGTRALILPGVTIGKNSIVGAGAVVTKDVAPGSVVAGNPAVKICSTEDYYNKKAVEALNRPEIFHFKR